VFSVKFCAHLNQLLFTSVGATGSISTPEISMLLLQLLQRLEMYKKNTTKFNEPPDLPIPGSIYVY